METLCIYVPISSLRQIFYFSELKVSLTEVTENNKTDISGSSNFLLNSAACEVITKVERPSYTRISKHVGHMDQFRIFSNIGLYILQRKKQSRI